MKLLNNPWIVGGLCVIAAGLVITRPSRPGGRAEPSPPQTIWPCSPRQPRPARPPARWPRTPPPEPRRAPMQRHRRRSSTWPTSSRTFTQWWKPPRATRSCCRRRASRRAPPAAPFLPVSHWKLKAIWMQTGSRLAAINNGVYAEGEPHRRLPD